MPLPTVIPVRYTEEEAEYVSLRPVVRQMLRPPELIELVLSVTGKDATRIGRILHAGTIVYHQYRYWWETLETEPAELAALLEQFPSADPARTFHALECDGILLEAAGGTHVLKKDALAARSLLRRESLWDLLVDLAAEASPAYHDYSYEHRADLFVLALPDDRQRAFAVEVLRIIPRRLRREAALFSSARRLFYICPRIR